MSQLMQAGRRFASTTLRPEALAQTGLALTHRATAMLKPLLYYGQVSFQLLKSVAQHQRLALPNLGEAQLGMGHFLTALQTGAWRKVTLGQAGTLALEGVKIYGFFLFGEMVGRGSVVGYQIPGAEQGGHH